jgi:hypothetical protein
MTGLAAEQEGEDRQQDLASAAKDTYRRGQPGYGAGVHLGLKVVRVRRCGKLVGQDEISPCFHQFVPTPVDHDE